MARCFGNRFSGSPAAIADLLSLPVLQLSAGCGRRGARFGTARNSDVRPEFPAISRFPPKAGDQSDYLGFQSFRPPALRNVLRKLHRKSLGNPLHSNQFGLGRGAHSRAVLPYIDKTSVPWPAEPKREKRRPDTHSRVSLS